MSSKTEKTALTGLLYLTRMFHYLLAKACMLQSSCYRNTADCNLYTVSSSLTQASPLRKTPTDSPHQGLIFTGRPCLDSTGETEESVFLPTKCLLRKEDALSFKLNVSHLFAKVETRVASARFDRSVWTVECV